ncbi:hypothetical protein [Desulfonatronovibrio hydrogenovorans]|uniref:hypothetical protein n=1 Tax=Desulfonatronovibrio hydrogenovorans TaxID=53245 RepID=UPI0005546A6D|nr:hypothetical protein [Desulfonatronovibrio hydrogenovorans]
MSFKEKSRAWGWLAAVLTLTFMVGLAKVWVNVERVDLAYRMQRLQSEYRENQELRTKLTIEKNNLLSPYRLKGLGQEKGLKPPRDSQIRKIRN